MIEVRRLAFSYGRTQVLTDVHLDLHPGLNLVLGPNGCGKSTLLRLVGGVEAASAGTIRVDGFDLLEDEVKARERLTYVPEHPDLTPYANLREIVRLVARLRGRPDAEGDAALEALGMAGFERRSVRELSLGQRRRALLATARIATPPNILLDEPLDSLDRGTRAEMIEWIDQERIGGSSITIISHDLEPFAGMPARAGYLDQGIWHGFSSDQGFSMDALDRLGRALPLE